MIEVTEKQLEDWVCANVSKVVGHEDAVLVGRQMQLVNGGILDVLAARWHQPAHDPDAVARVTLTVIELKRDCIDDRAVAQVLGYMGALDRMVHIMSRIRFRGALQTIEIEGVLAAPRIDDTAQYAIQAAISLRYVGLYPTVMVDHAMAYATDHLVPPDHVSQNAARKVSAAICSAIEPLQVPESVSRRYGVEI